MTTEISPTLPRRQFIKTIGQAAASAAIVSGPLAALGQGTPPKMVFAIVGAAHIHTPNYTRILKLRGDVTVKYVWDHDHARAEAEAAKLGAQVVDDEKTIWADPDVKAVVTLSKPIATMIWFWPPPPPASMCSPRSRWASAPRKATKWPTRWKRRI